MQLSRSSHRRFSPRKGVLRNFVKFTGKQMCQACNFIKKKTLAQVFPCEFCETSKSTFFTEHLWATASDSPQSKILIRYFLEPVVRRCSTRWMFLEISQSCQENTFVKVVFSIKFQASQLHWKRNFGTRISLWFLRHF